jgi:ABC transporter substrate binding protein (PQQ-dependent alcohol dehydrogenase system)
VEQHGAAQLQNRFRAAFQREMTPEDYAAWAAMAAIAEATTRTKTTDPAALRAYMLGADFRLAGFLGAPLSFRAWNGQMRQPIPLVTERAVVALAPIDGFLHQSNTLDTLGIDAPESQCTAFGGPK